MEREKLNRSWVVNSAAWAEAVRGQRIESRRLVTDAAIVEAVRQFSPARVLDLGCGEGWLARELASTGIAVKGVDGSRPLIEAASALGGAEFQELSYEAIIDDPGSAGSGYDVIVANFSLLDDRVEALLHALLPAFAIDGRLIVQSVHPQSVGQESDGWRVETFATLPGDWAEAMPWYFRTVPSWRSTFERAGYIVAETREPLHPVTRVPASILWICVPAH